jgi:DNA-binding MarR family transcriptional regulator
MKEGMELEPLYSVDDYRPEDGVGLLIGMVRSQLMAALDEQLAKLGLTGAQLPVLYWIGQMPDATAATLCRAIGTDTGSMTRMLARLEEKGFIRRVRSQSDRRIVHLNLTAAGKALRPMIVPRVVKVLNHFLVGFRRDELETLKTLLQRMLANSREMLP